MDSNLYPAFRPLLPAPQDQNSPLPDVNSLGWSAKSTLSRLNASPAEKAARQTRLATAARTVLKCIGEDPHREGLLHTPEHYDQVLMLMMKGYEDHLADCHGVHSKQARFGHLKLARIAGTFSRRLRVQERLTNQIALCI
ncbi:hypothetical protein V8E53_010340 [Lactarius tabidus]